MKKQQLEHKENTSYVGFQVREGWSYSSITTFLVVCSLSLGVPLSSLLAQNFDQSQCTTSNFEELQETCKDLVSKDDCSPSLIELCCSCESTWNQDFTVCDFKENSFPPVDVTPSATPTPTATATFTPTATSTPTEIPTPTPSFTAIPTATVGMGTPTPVPLPACRDGLDNDGDGFTDYPVDAGCSSASDLAETDSNRICDNGIDDDGDGTIDLQDPDCSNPTDATEISDDDESDPTEIDISSEIEEISTILSKLSTIASETLIASSTECSNHKGTKRILKVERHIENRFSKLERSLAKLGQKYPATCFVPYRQESSAKARSSSLLIRHDDNQRSDNQRKSFSWKSKKYLEEYFSSQKHWHSKREGGRKGKHKKHNKEKDGFCGVRSYSRTLRSVLDDFEKDSQIILQSLSKVKDRQCNSARIARLESFLYQAFKELEYRVSLLPEDCDRCAADKDKVAVCHKGRKTLYLPPSAVDAHLAQEGGYLGICGHSISFEKIQPGALVSEVSYGTGIDGPEAINGKVLVKGINTRFNNPATQAAMIFDATCQAPNKRKGSCSGRDNDLRKPFLGNVLIVSEDLDSRDPDDEGFHHVSLSFDFRNIASGVVELFSIDLLDMERGATVKFFGGQQMENELDTIELPRTKDNGHATVAIRKEGVTGMKVLFKGSGAIDEIRFRPQGDE